MALCIKYIYLFCYVFIPVHGLTADKTQSKIVYLEYTVTRIHLIIQWHTNPPLLQILFCVHRFPFQVQRFDVFVITRRLSKSLLYFFFLFLDSLTCRGNPYSLRVCDWPIDQAEMLVWLGRAAHQAQKKTSRARLRAAVRAALPERERNHSKGRIIR